MLDLSVVVRDREIDKLDQFFTAKFEGSTFPVVASEPGSPHKWLKEHTWELASQTANLNLGQFKESLGDFLAHFSEIEDVRFKVKKSEARGNDLDARVYFFLVGRDSSGNREWVKAWINASARANPKTDNTDAGWLVNRWQIESVDSHLSEKDLFSEVGAPAGFDSRYPDYGKRGNDNSFWHGAAAADVNNDGFIDVYATGVDGNFLWLNQGDGQFKDVAEQTWTKVLP